MGKMKLCVGSPGSLADTKKILDAVGKDIAEVYLAVNLREFGSGRDRVYDLTVPELAKIVTSAQSYDVEISVAFNALCFNGRQYEKRFLEQCDELLVQLRAIGIRKLIIADPFLIDYVLNRHTFHVCVSSISMVDTVEKARLYEELGVHRIILPMDSARKRDFVEAVRKRVNCELEIMANLGCLYNCPHHSFHSQYHSHASRNEVKDLVSDGDPYKEFCTTLMQQEPWRVFSAAFLRPEDLPMFDEMGIDFVKLAGRELGVEWIINASKAYVSRTFKGNLLEILSTTHRIQSTLQIDNQAIKRSFIQRVTHCDKHCYGSCKTGGLNYCEQYSARLLK